MPARIAILCPGPSLREFGDREGYDVRIGVNRAVEAYRCDYWVALDRRTFGMTKPLGRPTLVSHDSAYRQMCRQWPEAETFPHLSYQSLDPLSPRVRWRKFSATTALVLASHLGASSIDCWGADWTGETDFDGYTHRRQNRTLSRWRQEARLWQTVCELLAERGATVRRVGHADTVTAAGE